MADQNKLYSLETSEKLDIDFDRVCRFCLSKTQNKISIYDKCVLEESNDSELDSIFNFVSKSRFIKVETMKKFPAHVCQNCYDLIRLCHLFSEVCQKSDTLLRDFYQIPSKNTERDNETENKICEKSHQLDSNIDKFCSTGEFNKLKETSKTLENVFTVYKQKLNLLSERLDRIKLNNPNLVSKHNCSSSCCLKFRGTSVSNFHNSETHCQKIVKLQCESCKKAFSSKNKLQRHCNIFHKVIKPELKNNNKKNNHFFCFYCTSCKEFESQDQLFEHLKISHNLKSKFFNCSHCNDLFLTRFSLNQHLSLVHKQSLKQITEEKCFVFSQNPSIEFSKKPKPWTCSKCEVSYSRKESLHNHVREKHNQTTPKGVKCPECPECPESFATNRQLLQHGITAHQKYFTDYHKVFKKIIQPLSEECHKEKNFECDVCHRRYIYKSSLRKHILAAHLGMSAKDAVACPYCNKTISNKLNLKSHIELVHEALFVLCPICKKKINFRTIGKHYKTHKTTTDMIYSRDIFICRLCGKVLKSKRSFEDHQTLHVNAKNELCDVCGSGFTTKKFLRLHKRIHDRSQRKVFKCDQCDKAFNGSHSLSRHLLTHSGKKNFICEICSKCFYTISELKRHVRFHKKDYRYSCQLCDKRFFDKSPFRHHMMKHRNVRPHKCQFCDKMFIVRGKMILHMASKHNVNVTNAKKVWKDPNTYIPLDDLL